MLRKWRAGAAGLPLQPAHRLQACRGYRARPLVCCTMAHIVICNVDTCCLLLLLLRCRTFVCLIS